MMIGAMNGMIAGRDYPRLKDANQLCVKVRRYTPMTLVHVEVILSTKNVAGNKIIIEFSVPSFSSVIEQNVFSDIRG